MSDEWIVSSVEDWNKEAISLFGEDPDNWMFVCPSCGQVQARRDFRAIGLPAHQIDEMIGYSCIGRWADPLGRVDFLEPTKGKGCNYLGGREPNISPITLIISEGEERATFGFSYE